MLDGAARLGELFDETERLGMPALATTDHGYLFGAFDFWKRATDQGIRPIIGVEAYVTPGTARTDKTRVRWGEEHQRKDDSRDGQQWLAVLSPRARQYRSELREHCRACGGCPDRA